MMYDWFKKGFLFGVEYELATFLPYLKIIDGKIMAKERAQILLLKVFNFVV